MRFGIIAAIHLALATRELVVPRWLHDPQHVSVDLKSADVRLLITLLAEAGRVNVVMADEVSGSVTLRIHDQSWEQALGAVLRAKHLDHVREGNILRIDTAAHLAESRARESATVPP